jgi:hypothetical protein
MLPKMFTYKGNDYSVAADGGIGEQIHPDTTKQYIGLVAQDCEGYMPELVTQTSAYIDGVRVDDVRQLDATGIIYALVNAVAELNTKIAALGDGGGLGMQTLEFTYNGTTTAPPASGQVRLNNTDQTMATRLYISNLSAIGIDRSMILDLLTAGNTIILNDKDDATKAMKYQATSVSAQSGYYDIGVTLVESRGSLVGGQRVTVSLIFT